MIHDVIINRRPYNFIWEEMREYLQQDHLTFANLETPVYPELPPEGYPAFNAPIEYLEEAIRGGVDAFSLANNHATDQGPLGIISTRRILSELSRNRPVLYAGTKNSPEEPFLTAYREIDNWRISFLAATEFLNNPFGSELVDTVPGAGAFRGKEEAEKNVQLEDLYSRIREARGKSDLVVVSFHGGREYKLFPLPEEREFYREIWRQGADIVWVHHPHVLQPWEYIEEEGRRGVIFHSTGNWISGQRWYMDMQNPDPSRVDTGDSAAYRVRVLRTEKGGRVISVSTLPVTNHKVTERGMQVIPFQELLLSNTLSPLEREFYNERYKITERRVLPWFNKNIPEE